MQDSKVDPNIALVKRLDQVIDRLEAINSTQIQQGVTSSSNTRLLEQQLQNQLDRRDRIVVAGQDAQGEVYAKEVKVKEAKETLTFNRAALFAGPNFGDQLGLNVGARAYLQILDSKSTSSLTSTSTSVRSSASVSMQTCTITSPPSPKGFRSLPGCWSRCQPPWWCDARPPQLRRRYFPR